MHQDNEDGQNKAVKPTKAEDYCMVKSENTAGDPKDHDVHVILYHMNGCPPCRAFLPKWKDEFLPKVRQNPNSRIYASTCENKDMPNYATERDGLSIESFPTIMIIYGDKHEKYQGRREDIDGLYNYALSLVNQVSKNDLKRFEELKTAGEGQCGGNNKNRDYFKYKYYKYKILYLKAKKANKKN